MSDSFYANYKRGLKGRYLRYSYILSGVLLFFLILTTYSQFAVKYPVLMPKGVSLIVYDLSTLIFLLAMISRFCDLVFISQAVTIVCICITIRILKRLNRTQDLARKDVIIGITLNSISAIIMIIRSFNPVSLLFEFLF